MLRILFFSIMLFLFSGALLLLVDRKIYQVNRREREKRLSTIMGWFNLFAAFLLLGFYLWKL